MMLVRRSSSSKSGSGGSLSVEPLSGRSEWVGAGFISQAVRAPGRRSPRYISSRDEGGKYFRSGLFDHIISYESVEH